MGFTLEIMNGRRKIAWNIIFARCCRRVLPFTSKWAANATAHDRIDGASRWPMPSALVRA
jgi:hypothetical protein